MERSTQRIVAIVVIAGLVAGGVIGVLVFVALLPGPEAYYVTPGVDKDDIEDGFMIKIGILGDEGQIVGDGAWEGAWLAAYEINSNGGIKINESDDSNTPNGTYYIGITMEDTDEMDPGFVTSKASAAAERIITTKEAQFTLGGFRTEAVLAYTEVLMQAKTMFLSCGASEDQFTLAVMNDPVKYKYWWRVTPTNSTTLGTQIIAGVLSYQAQLNATTWTVNPTNPQNITKFGLFYEDLLWTGKLVAAIKDKLAEYPAFELAFDEPFSVGLTSSQMKSHVENMKSGECDIVIPVISGTDSILLVDEYVRQEADFMLIGVDVQSQDSRFWEYTDGDCQYEIITQSITETNKTAKTLDFYSDFYEEWGHDPIYTASGAYDAINLYAMAINKTQSLDTLDLIDEFQTHLYGTDPIVGVGGHLTWTEFNDIYVPYIGTPASQYPHGVTLFAQWQAGGAKECIPCYVGSPYFLMYPGPGHPLDITTANMTIPDWLMDMWINDPTH